jgi:peptide/nickel transport system substrate-binding protein
VMSRSDDMRDSAPVSGGLTRRRLLQVGAGGAVALGVAACGGSSSSTKTSSSTQTAAQALKPVRGGTLTAGMITGGPSETLNPGILAQEPDLMRAGALFDPLVGVTADLNVVPWLAESWEPNKSATEWTFRLRDGVTWHNGKSLDADDLIWTINSWANPKNFEAPLVGLVDPTQVRKLDQLTVRVPLLIPLGDLASMFTSMTFGCLVIQNGATPHELETHPVGTGPFQYVSFTPGSQSVFDRNPNYWQHGKPYVDRLVVNSSFTAEPARLDALESGAINAAPIFPYLSARSNSSTSFKVQRSPGGIPYYMPMRVDKGPLADPRVRQALRLVADRQALVEGALAGFGTVANDLIPGSVPGIQYFDGSLHRTRDVEQAKALLKAAGQEGLHVTLTSSNVADGFVESATLLAEQATAAGITINVNVIPSSTYFTPAGGMGTRPFSQNFQPAVPSLTLLSHFLLTPGSVFNESHWGSQVGGAQSVKLIREASAAVDPSKAQELWNAVQEEQFNGGGYLVWGNADNVDAVANNVHDTYTTAAGGIYETSLADAWIG